jgi:sulfite reductase (NADPH) hemoprotein beta-component
MQEIASSGFYTINGCGDNVRNFMACPLSHYSKYFDGNAFAERAAKYFRLPTQSYIDVCDIDPKYLRDERKTGENFEYGDRLLNRKFKIGISAVDRDEKTGEYVPDNCVEVRTDDIGVVPILDGGSTVNIQSGGAINLNCNSSSTGQQQFKEIKTEPNFDGK